MRKSTLLAQMGAIDLPCITVTPQEMLGTPMREETMSLVMIAPYGVSKKEQAIAIRKARKNARGKQWNLSND